MVQVCRVTEWVLGSNRLREIQCQQRDNNPEIDRISIVGSAGTNHSWVSVACKQLVNIYQPGIDLAKKTYKDFSLYTEQNRIC